MSPYPLSAALSPTALLSLGALQEPTSQVPMQGMPDLVGALKKAKGCLGVETADTAIAVAFYKDGEEVQRLSIRLVSGQVNLIPW